MKTRYLLLALVGLSSTLRAQHYEWARSFTGTTEIAMVYGTATCVDPAGSGVYVAGNYGGGVNCDPGLSDFTLADVGYNQFITKMSPTGDLLWAHSFRASSSAIAADAAGNCYVFGTFMGSMDSNPGDIETLFNSQGEGDIFLIKLAPNGSFVWAQQFGGTGNDTGMGIHVSGNYIYCTGEFASTVDFDNSMNSTQLSSSDYGDVYVMKLGTDGAFQWAVDMGSNSNTATQRELGLDVETNTAGDVFVSGVFSLTGDFNPDAATLAMLTPLGTADAFILKLNANGLFQWAIRTGNEFNENNSWIAVGADGSVYHSGTTGDYTVEGSANEDIYVGRYTGNGVQLWEHRFGGPYMEQAIGIAVDETGCVYVSGDHSSPSVDFDPGPDTRILENVQGMVNTYLLKFTAAGDLVWATPLQSNGAPNSTFGLSYHSGSLYGSGYYFNSVDFDPAASQHFLSTPMNYASAFAYRFDTTGVADVTGIDELAEIPFSLYPNPAQEQLSVSVPGLAGEMELKVYNLAGEMVLSRQVNTAVSALEVAQLSSGMYVVEIRQNGAASRQKFLKK